MELIDPPSQKWHMSTWVVLLICYGVIVLFCLGLGVGRDSSRRPVTVGAVPQRAPASAGQAAPGPAGQEQERMLVRASVESAPAPAFAAVRTVRPARAAARKASAAAAKAPVKHLVVTRHLSNEPSHTVMMSQPQAGSRPAAPAAPAAREALAGGQQTQVQAPAPEPSTSYGTMTRDQIMGQEAGPVYNLKGRGMKSSAGKAGQASGSASGAAGQGDERQDGAEAAPEGQ